MKTIQMLPLLIIVCYLLMAAGCKKDNPQSELVTVNGETFGCRVNGKPFIADRWDYGNNIPPVSVTFWYSPVRNYRYLIAHGDKENVYVEILLPPPLIVGRKELKFNTRPYPIYSIANQKNYGLYRKNYPYTEYITNESLGGYVDIIYVDTINQKIEARFEFTGTDKYTGNKVTITNGYFKKI